jgi:hypothetical protein
MELGYPKDKANFLTEYLLSGVETSPHHHKYIESFLELVNKNHGNYRSHVYYELCGLSLNGVPFVIFLFIIFLYTSHFARCATEHATPLKEATM